MSNQQRTSRRATADSVPPWASGTEGREGEIYPVLDEDEMRTATRYGREIQFIDGQRLWEIGDQEVAFYLVVDGELVISHQDEDGEHELVRHGPGSYSGEIANMSRTGSLVIGRAAGAFRAIEIAPEALRDLLVMEAELGEKILTSFILRRMRMIAWHVGDVLLVGDDEDANTADLREFMSRNGIPFELLEPDEATDEARLDKIDLKGKSLPYVLCGRQQLERPSIADLAQCLGLTESFDQDEVVDLVIIGAGPTGLAAAVYAASEGRSVIVLERCAVGGQAGSSSRIENYMGFPTGISGQALTGRGFLQAQKFGARVAIAREAIGLECGDAHHEIALDNGQRLKTRAVLIASGAVYRQLKLARLEEFAGTGVHYGASHTQKILCRDCDVAIVGGGNSAGQAAMYLSRCTNNVYLVIRNADLVESMSDYLIRRIEATENIHLVVRSEVTAILGEKAITSIELCNVDSEEKSTLEVQHLFIFIGAKPNSDFVDSTIATDQFGFIRTGSDLDGNDLTSWPLDRRPRELETSCPRIFAAGDVRSGSVKRVASGVGEGSMSVPLIHQVISELKS